MTLIPCQQNTALRDQIAEFAEALKTEAHRLGNHGLAADILRTTRVTRNGMVQKESTPTPIRRT